MDKVTTIDEATSWFLNHSSGSVFAVNANGEEKECDNFGDASGFISQSSLIDAIDEEAITADLDSEIGDAGEVE